ncbi:flagellin [uncultured Cohaesibacter sp.]|uniref:flagellin N-terminal helical domain-containing protein n=1 Tax=uncultured Cohaesibacter sp. TaxID=1002546 RepID=UPI0029C7A68B|nr:flagellin [uncultured Cohaesibacter sp.]
MSDITLSAGVRANLLALQNTADMMASTQTRLATGKSVNSALDNPTNFFTSEGLNARSNELNNLMDSIGNATKVLEAADNGIQAITDLVESAQSTVKQAQANNSDAAGTHIQSDSNIDTTGTTGSTTKARVESQTLTALGMTGVGNSGAADSNFVITSTSDNGVTNTFDLDAHFAATGKALNDANGDGTTGDDYTIDDLVTDINASGVATASITEDGRLDLKASGNAQLSLEITDQDATDATTQDGATGTSIAAAFGFGASASEDLSDPADADYVDAGETAVTWADGAGAGDVDTLTIVNQAGSTDADNSELVSQFNEILSQIDELARDASYNGINLINGTGNDLTVAFNEFRDENKSELTIASADLSSSGLSLTDASSLSSEEASLKLDTLSEALTTLRSQASSFGSNLNTVTIREEFTKNMMNTLQTGADELVLADSNEEGANMLALQTRQSLSTTALSLASQADQAVLSFLR